jgi:uracil phosphoribosyltransferase
MKVVSAEFDKLYDENEYEQKIAHLVHNIKTGKIGRDKQEKEAWDQAVQKLSEGDHYLLVLIDPSLLAGGSSVRSPHDRLKLWLTAFGIVFVFLGLIVLFSWIF